MTIAEIKSRLTLAEVIRHYGLKADKQNRVCCPFHDDKTPSMQLYYKTQTCYCFSSNCKTHGKSMDVIDFVMNKEGISKHEALIKAAALAGAAPGTLPAPAPVAQAPVPTTGTEQILGNMFTYFKNAVHNSKPAQEYLKTRGLDATKIEVGYNTAQFHHGARRDETLLNNCVAVGLLSPWGSNTRNPDQLAYKPFGKYGICFALRDRGNHITGLYFRSTVNQEDQKHFYLKESKGLYPNYPDPGTRKLIIAESIIDTASLLQLEAITKAYGLLAAYGTNRLNEEMKAAISELKELEEIVFAFDNDEAGNQAAAKYGAELKTLLNENVRFSKLELPCKDVNETLTAHDPGIFTHLLETRVRLSFSIEESTEKENPSGSLAESSGEKEKAEILSKTLNANNPNKLTYQTETATYAILGGLPKAFDQMKVMLQVETPSGLTVSAPWRKSRNRVDLYEDKQVEKLAIEISEKLGLRKDLLAQELYTLTELLERYREKEQNGPATEEPPAQTPFTLKERTELEAFLKAPNVIHRLNELLGKTGIVGEEQNRIFLLLVAISYKMCDTLHSLVQGSSGSGKTRIVRQVSDCMPPESVTRFTRISDKALYNYPKNFFTNRLLVIEDMDGLGEEAQLAFRELQSGGELRSSVSIKLESGQITAGEKIVSGPIASMSCTTRGEIYEDNMSRVFLIAVDESAEQTARIIAYQNQKASGKINGKEEQQAKTLIQNLVRMIEPKEVINPYAEQVRLPEEAHKIRRLNDLFHHVITMVTLVNQYQRKKNEHNKLVAEIEDIETATGILFESIVLKVDELDGSLRQFYEKLKGYLQKHYKDDHRKTEFTQREIRQALHVSKAQINRYLQSLTELEYISASGFANKGFRYKIMYWDNYQALRKRIKDDLFRQVEALKQSRQ